MMAYLLQLSATGESGSPHRFAKGDFIGVSTRKLDMHATELSEDTCAIRQFMRGPSRILFTSRGLGWSGLLLEQHELSVCEWPESELKGLVLSYWNNATPLRCDHPDAHGHFVPKLVHPGTLSLYTSGALPTVRLSSTAYGLICAFDADFLLELPEQMRKEGNMRSVADGIFTQDKRCFTDAILQQILEKLSNEARRGGHFGAFFANHLIRRLRARLCDLTRTSGDGLWLKNRMDANTLRWLSNRVDTTPEADLNLNTLAAESGSSKRQLLRYFRERTGRSPHQYILDLRIEKARRLMLQQKLNLLDIALECGFSSHAHFTYVFSQRIGIPPGVYRKRL
jgi:AraC family transcriptional regulator